MSYPQYQQQPGQGWGPPPPQQPKKSSAGKIIGFGCLGIVVLFFLLAVVGVVAYDREEGKGAENPVPLPGASAPEDPSSDAPADGGDEPSAEEPGATEKEAPAGEDPEDDVRITACEADPLTDWPAAKVTITNHSDEEANYIVQVEFLDGGTRIGEGMAATNNLGAGKVAKETAQGLSKAPSGVKCKVSKVTRYPSF